MDNLDVIDTGVGNQQSRYFQKKKLPNAVAVLVLGIVSIVICWLGVVTGIIALALASKDMKEYRLNPDSYDEGSFKNLNAGRICAIIGVCLSGIVILFYAFAFMTAINTANSLNNFDFEQFDNLEENSGSDEYRYEDIDENAPLD